MIFWIWQLLNGFELKRTWQRISHLIFYLSFVNIKILFENKKEKQLNFVGIRIPTFSWSCWSKASPVFFFFQVLNATVFSYSRLQQLSLAKDKAGTDSSSARSTRTSTASRETSTSSTRERCTSGTSTTMAVDQVITLVHFAIISHSRFLPSFFFFHISFFTWHEQGIGILEWNLAFWTRHSVWRMLMSIESGAVGCCWEFSHRVCFGCCTVTASKCGHLMRECINHDKLCHVITHARQWTSDYVPYFFSFLAIVISLIPIFKLFWLSNHLRSSFKRTSCWIRFFFFFFVEFSWLLRGWQEQRRWDWGRSSPRRDGTVRIQFIYL